MVPEELVESTNIMDHIQPLEPLNISGNVSSNWRRWNLYVKASGAIGKTEDVQCAIFFYTRTAPDYEY